MKRLVPAAIYYKNFPEAKAKKEKLNAQMDQLEDETQEGREYAHPEQKTMLLES